MKARAKIVIALGCVGATLALLFSYSPPASAIPAWARRYGMDCSFCHLGATNRLTAFGREFMIRGDRSSDDEGPTEIGDLNIGNYMSFASKFRFTANEDKDPSTAFDVEALSIYSGGPLYEGFSYFFEFYLHERGSETTKTGGQNDTAVRSKLAEAYLQYNSAPMEEDFWFARAGQITPRVIHTASAGGRVSISRPRIIGDNVGAGNFYTPRDRSYGLTVGFQTASKTFGEVGIVNGGGGNSRSNQPELNNAKDFFASVQQDLDDYGSNVALYGYWGTYPIAGPPAWEDEFSRYGVLAAFQRDEFEISGAWMTGRNDLEAGGHREPKGWYLEGAYVFDPMWTVYARYDDFDPDLSARITGGAIGVSYRLANMGRMVLEGTEKKTDGGSTEHGLQFEINWMF